MNVECVYSSPDETYATIGDFYSVTFLCDGATQGYAVEVEVSGGLYRTGMDEELTVFTEHVS